MAHQLEPGAVVTFADGRTGVVQGPAGSWSGAEWWDCIVRSDAGLVRYQFAAGHEATVEPPRSFAIGEKVRIGGGALSGVVRDVEVDGDGVPWYRVEAVRRGASGIEMRGIHRVPSWLLNL